MPFDFSCNRKKGYGGRWKLDGHLVCEMGDKNYTDVIIGGNVYKLGGYEKEEYLQKVASYINGKLNQLDVVEGYRKQSPEFQGVLLALNIADDYFKAQDTVRKQEKKLAELEKEVYSIKHELVTLQMQLEAAKKEIQTAGGTAKPDKVSENPADKKAQQADKQQSYGRRGNNPKYAAGNGRSGKTANNMQKDKSYPANADTRTADDSHQKDQDAAKGTESRNFPVQE